MFHAMNKKAEYDTKFNNHCFDLLYANFINNLDLKMEYLDIKNL